MQDLAFLVSEYLFNPSCSSDFDINGLLFTAIHHRCVLATLTKKCEVRRIKLLKPTHISHGMLQ